MRLPKSYREITINQFSAINDILKDDSLSELEKNIRLLSIIAKKDISEVEAMPVPEFKNCIKKLEWISEINYIPAPTNFKCGKYYWKPIKDVTHINMSQFIDISSYYNDESNIINNLPAILATICTPYRFVFGLKFKTSLSFDEKKKILINASIHDIYPISLFFCAVYSRLQKDILIYLSRKQNQMKREIIDGQISMLDSALNIAGQKNGY